MKIDRQGFRENLWTLLFFVLLGIFTIVIVHLINGFQDRETIQKNIVGAVFVGSVDDDGWNQQHYEGLLGACDKLGASLIIREDVAEEPKACGSAVEELVKSGCRIIFLTSDGFGNNVRSVTSAYSDISFYTVSPQADAPNVTSYYGRMYQARYGAGIIAGMMTKTNTLGYVAAKSTPQVNRGINAFTLGARSVNPDAVVKVRMVGSWTDINKERELTQRLIDEDGADVITCHTSVPVAIDVAEENQVYSIGYNITERGRRSRNYLASLVFDWDILYTAILQDYLRGGRIGDGEIYWWGADEDVVSIEDQSDLIDRKLDAKLKEAKGRFKKGQEIFAGEIKRSDGKIMCESGERMSDDTLLYDMTWFVEGVEVYED